MPIPSPTILLEEATVVNATAFESKGERASSMALTDPIATHLLVETALGDSKAFDVLPYEELEALKKEDAMIVQRIDTMRRKLVLETKVRDAANSLSRLHATKRESMDGTDNKSQRRSIEQAQAELALSTKKCEDLSRESYYLEQRSRQIQTQLLKHTAAVLQITYGNGHRPKMNDSSLPGGRPYSPDSLGDPNTDWDRMNDYSTGDRGINGAGGDIDDMFDDINESNTKEMPASTKRMKEEHLAIGQRLNDLSLFVCNVVGQVNDENAFAGSQPPTVSGDLHKIDFEIFEHVNFIHRGLEELKEEPEVNELLKPSKMGQSPAYNPTEANLLRLMLEMNNKLIQVLHATNTQKSTPQVPSVRDGLATHISFAQSLLAEITQASKSMSEISNRTNDPSMSRGEKLAQFEATISGLWQIMQAGEDDSRERKAQGYDSDDDLSPDEDDDLSKDFSLSGFSTKVQWIVAKSIYMKEKQRDMRRRMCHQRDNHGAQSARSLNAQLDQVNEAHATTKSELSSLTARLAESHSRIKEIEATHSSSLADLQRKVEHSQTSAHELNSTVASITQQRDAAQSQAQKMQADLTSLTQERNQAQGQIQRIQSEAQSLEAEIVRLKSELTVTKAEADAAHGSRQERAKATDAANLASSEAAAREDVLRKELQATLSEFEELTRASVEAEREREEREKEVDRLRDVIESLEAQLSEERIGKIGLKSPGSDGGSTPGTTSSGVLRSEFKKMMKDMRADHMKALRAEQEERRKLESQLRMIRRDQMAQKPLPQKIGKS